MSFSASLFSVYSKVIVQAASHRSAKDVYNSEMEPDAFQYHDLDSSYVKDLKVPSFEPWDQGRHMQMHLFICIGAFAYETHEVFVSMELCRSADYSDEDDAMSSP